MAIFVLCRWLSVQLDIQNMGSNMYAKSTSWFCTSLWRADTITYTPCLRRAVAAAALNSVQAPRADFGWLTTGLSGVILPSAEGRYQFSEVLWKICSCWQVGWKCVAGDTVPCAMANVLSNIPWNIWNFLIHTTLLGYCMTKCRACFLKVVVEAEWPKWKVAMGAFKQNAGTLYFDVPTLKSALK